MKTTNTKHTQNKNSDTAYKSQRNQSSSASKEDFFDNNKKTHNSKNTSKEQKAFEKEKPSKAKKPSSEQVGDENVLKINENYAKKFDELKRREAIEKAKLKYGQDYFFKESDEESDQESEDSVAELVNDRVLEKFVETIVKLQDDEKVKELVQTEKPIFEEEDFADPNKEKRKKEKAYTIKDALLNFKEEENETGINDNQDKDGENNLFSVNYKEKRNKKVDKEKEEFMKVTAEVADEADNAEDFLDDGFLKVKKSNENEEKYFQELETRKQSQAKTNKKNNENNNNLNEDGNPILEEITNLQLDEILKKRKNVKNLEVLKKFWGEGQNLDPNEKFLRNYILSEAWINNDENSINRKQFMMDKEDEEKDQFFEEFEERYNFRYEEEGGANITTHRRDLETFRIKDDSKKIKRKEREIKKEEEKGKIISDLQLAKEAKKFELKGKLEHLQKIAGTDKIKELADELEKEFDPENFDKIMSKIYNEEYYQTIDKEEDIEEAIEEKMFDYKTNKSLPNKEKLLEMERLENEGFEPQDAEAGRKKEKKEKKGKKNSEDYSDEAVAIPEGNKENEEYADEGYGDEEMQLEDEEGEDPWFYCDNCFNVIKENKIKYECETCDDYCLCKGCFVLKNHQHQMKKSKVPLGCKPPQNWIELVEANKPDDDLVCCLCNDDIVNNYYFLCEECNDGKKFCKSCRGKGKSIHEHKLTKFVFEEDIKKEEEEITDPKKKIEKLIDEKYDTVVDDLIAGKIPTKFHYSKVKNTKDNEELTDDMLLYLDDKTLNKFIPLKALAPYKEGYVVAGYKKKRLLAEFQREVDKTKKEFVKEIKQKKEIEEKNQSFLQKKRNIENKEKGAFGGKKLNKFGDEENKNNAFDPNNKQEYRKKKRLETYGITD